MGNCKDCDFNFVNVHYYRLRADVTPEQYAIALRNYIDNEVPAVQAKYEQLNGLPIFVGQVSSAKKIHLPDVIFD